MSEMFWCIKKLIHEKRKSFCVNVDSNLWTLSHIGPHENQTVFYYCNTAETVYDGTVELSFTLIYSRSGWFNWYVAHLLVKTNIVGDSRIFS